MRRLFVLSLVVVTLLGATLPAYAADGDLSAEQTEQVRRNCKAAQSVMQRLQTTDVATRISRGRVYENLLAKLIGPFNTRVSSNNYDVTGLNAITNELSGKFTDFKDDYRTYENSFTNLLKMDCEADPAAFYTLLVSTRENRDRLATDITDMDALIGRYASSFDDLRASVTEKAR